MIHIRLTRGLKWPMYCWNVLYKEGYVSPESNGKMAFHNLCNARKPLDSRTSNTGLRNTTFSSAVFESKPPNIILTNLTTYKLKNKLLRNQNHSTNSGEAMDIAPTNEIPISMVARILLVKNEVKPQKPETENTIPPAKMGSTSKVALKEDPTEPILSRAPKEAAANSAATWRGKAITRSNTVLRTSKNLGNRTTPQLPKTAKLADSNHSFSYKETYEKLRKLGLLKSRMGNCHVGMTSPSGKSKFSASNVKTKIDKKVPKKVKAVFKRPTEIQSKFLDNNVVVKVQHYYISQGKEVPEELKSLTNRFPSIKSSTPSNCFAALKRRRYQVYPCTSPSSAIFTRNRKRGE